MEESEAGVDISVERRSMNEGLETQVKVRVQGGVVANGGGRD